MIGPVLDWPGPFLFTFAQRATGRGPIPSRWLLYQGRP